MYRQPSVEVATLVEADDLFRRAAVYDPVGIASIAAWSDSSLAQSTRPLGAGIIAANWLSTAFSTARVRVSPFCLASFRILSSTRLARIRTAILVPFRKEGRCRHQKAHARCSR